MSTYVSAKGNDTLEIEMKQDNVQLCAKRT